MRSFDRSMPEELNRVLTDHASDLLICSTETAVANLEREGAAGELHLVGDVMADVSLAFRDIAEERSSVLADLEVEPGAYLVVTAHRAGNVDRVDRLEKLTELLAALPLPAVFPRTPAHARATGGRRPRGPPRRRAAGAAARLPRLPQAGAPRPRRAHRLGRRAEGGLSAGGAVRDAARHHGVGRDGGERMERARGPRPRRGARGARACIRRPSGPSSTAAATPPSAFARYSPLTLSAYEDRSRRARLRRAAARRRVRRGGPRRDRRGHRPARRGGSGGRAISHVEDVPDERAEADRGPAPGDAPATPTWRRSRRSSSPSRPRSPRNREPDLQPLIATGTALAGVLRAGQLVVLESTTYPGTTREQFVPLLEESGLAAGRDFYVAFSPERIDPGRTDYTMRNTPKVVGGLTDECRRRARRRSTARSATRSWRSRLPRPPS